MTTKLQAPTVLLGLFAILAGTGCGTATSSHFGREVSSSLVMATQQDPSAAWEYGRNDELLNVGQLPIAGGGWAEIRTYDRLRTSNGRPRESSTTFTRTLSTRGTY